MGNADEEADISFDTEFVDTEEDPLAVDGMGRNTSSSHVGGSPMDVGPLVPAALPVAPSQPKASAPAVFAVQVDCWGLTGAALDHQGERGSTSKPLSADGGGCSGGGASGSAGGSQPTGGGGGGGGGGCFPDGVRELAERVSAGLVLQRKGAEAALEGLQREVRAAWLDCVQTGSETYMSPELQQVLIQFV